MRHTYPTAVLLEIATTPSLVVCKVKTLFPHLLRHPPFPSPSTNRYPRSFEFTILPQVQLPTISCPVGDQRSKLSPSCHTTLSSRDATTSLAQRVSACISPTKSPFQDCNTKFLVSNVHRCDWFCRMSRRLNGLWLIVIIYS